MHAVELIFAAGWAIFWAYWLAAAFSMKKGRVPWSRELGIRAVIIVIAVLLVRVGAFRHQAINTDPWRAGIGLILFACGLAFAVRARRRIGRNWGTPMTLTSTPPQRAGNLTSQDVSVVDFVSGSTAPGSTIQQTFRAVGTGRTSLTGVFEGCPASAPACIPQPIGFHITVQ